MSWSVSAIGKAPAVAVEIERQFTAMTYQCPEPEDTAKQAVRQAIAALANGHTRANCIVKVGASGSQSYSSDGPGQPSKDVSNSLSLTFDTYAGAVE